MKIKLLKLSITIILIINVSCKETRDDLIQVNSVFIEPSDTFKLAYPQNLPFKEPGNSWSNNKSTISYISESPFQINTFDIMSNSWVKLPLELQGPNGLKSLGVFKFINSDSIIYFPNNIPEYFLISNDGRKLKTFKIHEENTQYKKTVYENPSILFKNNIIAFPSSKFLDPKKSSFVSENRLITKYNRQTKEEISIIQYPNEFQNSLWSSNDRKYTVLFEENRILINFAKSHFIYSYNYEGKFIEKHSAYYQGIRDAKPLNIRYTPLQTAIQREFIGYYSNLLYNLLRKEYYRIGISYESKGDLDNLNMKELQRIYHSRKVSVLVLNKDLKHESTYILQGVSESSLTVNKNGFIIEGLINDNTEDNLYYLQYSLKQ